MTATDVGRELLFPFSKRPVIYAVLFYWFLIGLSLFAGLAGLWLLILCLPAFFRFLLCLLEARANGRPAPVPAIEMFNPADNAWSLTPLIHTALGIWAMILGTPLAQSLAAIAFAVIMPASMAVLAVTHSPLQSLNPLAIVRMVGSCGIAYYIVPAVLTVTTAIFVVLWRYGIPALFLGLVLIYGLVLVFSMTGAVLHAKGIAVRIEIDAPLEPGEDRLADDLERQRQAVANHAYGFISRGNRAGGLAHVHDWVRSEADAEDAWRWFFEAMLDWENPQPALFFAQEYLDRLLDWQRDMDAIKLITRCLHQNADWRPATGSMERVQQLLARHARDDLANRLAE
ncbi:MAG: hypothetical protein R3192_09180 [Woeseiaceae bacterium]|nr:hypothetical protein [Woeseiaceae bacterium]